ncbi:uncharacterized protein LOC135121710 isoform X2 [Zophobas morio]
MFLILRRAHIMMTKKAKTQKNFQHFLITTSFFFCCAFFLLVKRTLLFSFTSQFSVWTCFNCLGYLSLTGVLFELKHKKLTFTTILFLLASIHIYFKKFQGFQDDYRVLADIQGEDTSLKVVQFLHDNFTVRLLKVDHSHIGGEYVNLQLSAFSIFHLQESLYLAHRSPQRFLSIGLGVGVVAGFMQRQGLQVDVVELDPRIVDLATTYFSFFKKDAASVRIYIEDVAKWIRRPEAETNRYDLILHDVYSGGFVPPNLFTREFLSAIRSLLSDGGIFCVNYFGFVKGEKAVDMRLLTATLLSLYKFVRCFGDEHLQATSPSNYICLASNKFIKFRKPDHKFFKHSLYQGLATSIEQYEFQIATNFSEDQIITEENCQRFWISQKNSALKYFLLMNKLFSIQTYWGPLA